MARKFVRTLAWNDAGFLVAPAPTSDFILASDLPDLSATYLTPSSAASTYAPLASPALTGTPTAPTATAGTNTTQIASTAFVQTAISSAVSGLLNFKGSIDCSANPNYPAGNKGDTYYVSVAGKIGGASGVSVDVGDAVIASATNAGGTQAAVGTSWFTLEHNIAGVLQSANNLSDVANAATARTNLGLGTIATLSSVSLTANVSGTLPIASGGTGATTAAAALTALGGVSITGATFTGNVTAPWLYANNSVQTDQTTTNTTGLGLVLYVGNGTVARQGAITLVATYNSGSPGLVVNNNVGSPIMSVSQTGVLAATQFSGSGATLTNINASNLTSGTIPSGVFPATLPAASGVNLTSLNASNIGSGTVPVANLPAATTAAAGILQKADQAAMEAETAGRAVTSDVVKYAPAAVKAWAYVTVSGGVATLRRGYNVASVSRSSTGVVSITFTNSLSDALYTVVATVDTLSGTGNLLCNVNTRATNSCGVIITNGAATVIDPSGVSIVIMGDF